MNVVIISGGRLNKESAPAVFEKTGIVLAGTDRKEATEKERKVCIIAVDGGLKYCKEWKIHPDYLVGDFDTIEGEILQEYSIQSDIKISRYDPEKDLTDTDAAVNLAMEIIEQRMGQIKEQENCIYLLGGIGSRMDHTLANIGCLKKTMKHRIPMKILDRNNCIYGFDHSFSLQEKNLIYKENLSLLSLERVEGLTIRGMKYTTEELSLPVLESRGVSNYITEKEATVEFTSGVLLVVESRD